MVRIRLLVAALTLAAALFCVPSASAAPPTITPVPSESASGRFCPDFDVLLTVVANKEKAITFSSGATIITGRNVIELTNLSTGKTIRLNTSGPGFISADQSTLTLRGRGLLFGEAGFFGPGAPPTLTLVSGVAVITLDAQGNPTGLSVGPGHTEDLCPVLADP